VSHLLDLRSVVFIHPEYLDGKHLSVLIRCLPNIGESTGRDGVLAGREGRFDLVRVREESVYLASPALFPDASFVNIRSWREDIYRLKLNRS
jgi:hypothetical protein